MAKVKFVGDAEASSWEASRDRLLRLVDGSSLSLDVDNDTWLIVLHIAEFGYLVTGCGEGEKDYFTLIDRSLGDAPVSAFDGGNTNDYPRYVFVSEALLLKATEYYYRTGQRSPECEWVPDQDAMY